MEDVIFKVMNIKINSEFEVYNSADWMYRFKQSKIFKTKKSVKEAKEKREEQRKILLNTVRETFSELSEYTPIILPDKTIKFIRK